MSNSRETVPLKKMSNSGDTVPLKKMSNSGDTVPFKFAIFKTLQDLIYDISHFSIR